MEDTLEYFNDLNFNISTETADLESRIAQLS